MWVDEEGNLHTAALPEPRALVGSRLLDVIDALSEAQVTELEGALDVLEGEIAQAVDVKWILPAEVGEPIPPVHAPELKDVGETGIRGVCDAIRRVPGEWRLDALYLVIDILDAR